MLFLDEPMNKERKSLVQGELKALFDGYNKGKIRDLHEFQAYYDKLIQDITLKSGITISGVEEDAAGKGHRMKSLTYKDQDRKTYKVEAYYWVENTDFNALTGLAFKHKRRIPGMETIEKAISPTIWALLIC